MPALGTAFKMLAMTRPITSSRLWLIADPRPATVEGIDVPVRRYRMARLRLDSHPPTASERYPQLGRIYD